jgi:ABC-type antimicrobial peptide transport system permease subunit
MVAGEGVLVAVAAALAGCRPGWLLAWIVHKALVGKGIVPAGLRLEVGWIPFVVAGGSAVLVVQIAGIAAGRRAAKIRPTAALAESTVQPRLIGVFRLLLGLGALAGVIVGYTAVAVANTLVMTTTERQREFALLQLIGATSRQVLRMMRWEAALIAVLGITVGTGVGYLTLVGFSRALGPGGHAVRAAAELRRAGGRRRDPGHRRDVAAGPPCNASRPDRGGRYPGVSG